MELPRTVYEKAIIAAGMHTSQVTREREREGGERERKIYVILIYRVA